MLRRQGADRSSRPLMLSERACDPACVARTRSPRRIFLGPIEIAGVFSGLEAGFRELGVPARFIDISGDPFAYRASPFAHLLAGPTAAIGRSPDGRLTAHLRRVARGLARVVVFVAACLRFDAFVLGGTGFFYGWELPILRLLHKKVVWVFLGSDHRPPYLNGRFVRSHGPLEARSLAHETRRVSNRVRRVEAGADAIVANEASAQFHRRPFVRLLSIGLPTPVGGEPAVQHPHPPDPSSVVRILHCPTDPVAKGSSSIRTVVDELAASGLPIVYREMVGRPHSEVLEAVREADLVVDEMYGDTPMGVLAAEAAAAGTPTVCGGYFADLVPRLIPAPAVPPTAFVEPGALGSTLRRLVEDRSARMELGEAARAFVLEQWRPAAVAERVLEVLSGRAPKAWYVEPATITYVDGYGLPRPRRIRATAELVTACGASVLALDHRPDLLRVLLADASIQ